ncbi:nuclease-related domain-containing protein [Cellulomonas composti]|uniref:nuclease-related domain-containing protein n=1 Tax=Cellulomonas composti TaxID=266130 RepID=UPI0011BEFF02|nr:nuclease-related domain-containing protein [Cellulomonas composti]
MDQLLTVRRWRRYGADRLFVTQETGARVGSVDLQSGEVVVDDPELEDRLREAAQEYLRKDVTELVLPMPRQPFDEPMQTAMEAWLGPREPDDERTQRGASLRKRLERLYAEGWHVVHDVPLGRQGSVLEHLLIGPGGIYTVAERRHPGSLVRVHGRNLTVDGAATGYLHAARMEAQRVQGLLLAAGCAEVRVRSILVVQAELETDGVPDPDGTLVVTRTLLPAAVRAMPAALEPDRIAALANVARQRVTWAR